MDRIAVLSDVHGNVTGLRAVLADIESRGIETIYNLGDVAGKGPRGAEAVRISQQRCTLTVRGNWDDFLPRLHEGGPGGPGSNEPWPEAMWWWHDELSDADRHWLANLPLSHDLTMSGRRVRMFHASAASVHTRVHFHHTPEEFEAMFAATDLTGPGPAPDVVLYGDIHDVYVEVVRGRTLANAGSVGNALDEPTAAYLILEGHLGAPAGERPLSSSGPLSRGAFSIQIVRVPYDVEAEIAIATELGMPQLAEYAAELRTGVYRGSPKG